MSIPANPSIKHTARFGIGLTIVAFGILLLTLVWGAVYARLQEDRGFEIKAAERQADNLARALEEHTVRTIREADQVLLFIIDGFTEHGGRIDLRRFAEDGPLISRIYNQFGIIDERGMLAASSHPFKPVSLADRAHFQVHAGADTGQLFISKPVVGRVSGKPSIQLSRRINKPDLSFGGVAVVSMDPSYFTTFYDQVNLGKDSVIWITGTDGVVRAMSSTADSPGARRTGATPDPNVTRPTPEADSIVRTRALRDYPLVVSVGISQDEALAGYRHRRQNYLLAGTLASITIAAFTLFLFLAVRRQRRTACALAMSNSELARTSESNARMAAIVESSEDAIVSRDLDYQVLTWNAGAERLFGWKADEIIGLSSDVLVPEDSRNEMWGNAADLEQRSVVSARDTVRMNRNGQRIQVSVMSSPIRNRSGEIRGVSLVYRDITDRKRTEQALQELTAQLEQKVAARTVSLQAVNEQLQSFAYSVSHDLRGPLCTIDGLAQMLDDGSIELGAEGRQIVAHILQSTNQLFAMIESVLQLSRLGEIEIAVEPHDMDALMREVSRDVRVQYPHVSLVANTLGTVHGDLALLRQVWANLVGNAAKFSSRQENPKVVIERVDGVKNVVFCVKDNGIGFDMHRADKLFGLFQRMHNQKEFPGSGVGLAIVRRIVERHGGRVWAEAIAGRGASFYFTLSDG